MTGGFELIIFDFDGVIADSELIANEALAAALCEIGLPTTVDDALANYMGRRWADCAALIEERLGGPLPADFAEGRRATTRPRMESELEAVAGVHEFLAAHAHIDNCIASSSSLEWLGFALDRFGLAGDFQDRLFSGTQVERGKPAPDLFLLAAATLGHAPERTLVIEDSVAGVVAGRAAGMTVIGLAAGSHCGDGYGERLAAAGAHHVAHDYAEVAAILAA